ncbi:hypothetical protein HH1059_12230 [Halorhodospira halochloris]|uniref:Uncharacterized protein n=1 Tax=Halorhodospira halochloris TaxID=1052 RepID=A0A0X8X9L8_HALHR|nr:hypothetical protein [Halorhodospira halochloris]MCG5548812.1 hypothetical protein [Halorhodospira halochloris]BAU57919.1 hypothetical protein HH1059_12230 [Halorhodospira halochloris]
MDSTLLGSNLWLPATAYKRSETCQDERLNLIVDVQIDPATAADNSYLQEAVTNSEQTRGSRWRRGSSETFS